MENKNAGASRISSSFIFQKDKKEKKAALILSILSGFLPPFMGSSLNVALPVIAQEFKADPVLLSWITTAYLLSTSIFLIPSGKLADVWGRKKIFLTGTILYTLGSFLCVIPFSIRQLLIYRVVQGMGSAMIFATSIAILSSVFPKKQRGRVLGINVASVYTGLSVGPFIGGILTENLSWRWIFLVNIPAGILIVVMIIFRLKGEWRREGEHGFDIFGAIIYGFCLFSLIYGFSHFPAPKGLVFMSVSITGFIIFLFWEQKQASPLFEVKLFYKNRTFGFSNLAALLNYSATFAVSFMLNFYLQYIKGKSPQIAGLILLIQPVIQASLSPLAGWLSDRKEPRILASIGMTLTTSGLVLLSMLGRESGMSLIISALSVLGFGFALFSSPNTNAIMSSVSDEYYGIAAGTLGTMRVVGQVLSMGLIMLLFSLTVGRIEITPVIYGNILKSIKLGFVMFSGLCFIGILSSLARGNVR